MKAFVINGRHNAKMLDQPAPDPAPGEALVRVRAVGVCGSDLHAYEGSQPFFQYPEIPGHEVVGTVERIVPRPGGPIRLPNRPIEEDLAPGERVVLDPALPCGRCHPCTHGRYNCCESMRVIGVHAPGAMAEYYVAPTECLHRVPDSMPDEIAAMVEPLSIGVQANNRARITEADRVLVIGAGTIGLCVMMVAKSRGAAVAMTDLSKARRDAASRMGADAALDPRRPSFVEDLAGFSMASGPTVVIEAVGAPATVLQALDLAVPGGRVVVLGLVSEEICMPGNVLVKKELDVRGSRLHGGTVPPAVELIASGEIDVSPLLTHRLPLDDAEAALSLMAEEPDVILKAVLSLA